MRKAWLGETIGRIVLGLGRVVRPLVPGSVRRFIDDRFFGAVFQVTRVTNDHYGYRPEESDGEEEAGEDENG